MRKGAKTDQKLSPVGKNSKKTFIVLKTKFAMKEKFDRATLTFFIHPFLPLLLFDRKDSKLFVELSSIEQGDYGASELKIEQTQ